MCFFWILCKCKWNICCYFHCIGYFPMKGEIIHGLALVPWSRRLSILCMYPNYPCSASSSSLPVCFQYHNLAAKPFSLCVFWGVFHPLQGAVKSQLWGFFIANENMWSWWHCIPSCFSALAGRKGTHTGLFNSLTHFKINNPPQGYSDISVICTLSIWKQTHSQEQWWHLCCGEFS